MAGRIRARPGFVKLLRGIFAGQARTVARGSGRMAEVSRGKFVSGGMWMLPFRPSRRSLLMAAPLLAIPLGGGIAAPAGRDFGEIFAGVERDAISRGICS